MENHPIPQDITGFQFKLIGDMTLKQFAYLAVGTVLAWIIFSTPASLFIKFPLSSIFALFGVSFAFFSISGRPMDTMLINFMRATFSPTKYIYQNPNLAAQVPNVAPAVEISTPSVDSKTNLASVPQKSEFDFFRMLSQLLHPTSNPSVHNQPVQDQSSIPTHIITAHVKDDELKIQREEPKRVEEKEENEISEIEEETKTLEERLKMAVAKEKESVGLPSYEEAHKKALEIEKILSDTLLQKQQLEKEIMDLKKQLEMQKKEVYTPSKTYPTQTPNVRTIANKAQGKSAGLPTLPEFPNIITGIVKDPRGNPLQNILVEVKDASGNPVRAFKTNPLGQFQASTPLSNGSYTIEFEDPGGMNKFDKVGFAATGAVILPIEVFSIDTREELRKSLFTN